MEARESSAPSGFSVREDTLASTTLASTAVISTTRKRILARPVVLSRAQEYAFIRADMRRLGLTAGALFVVMVVLLFIVD